MAIAARDGGVAFNNGGEMAGGARASADMAAAQQEADARNKDNAEIQILLSLEREIARLQQEYNYWDTEYDKYDDQKSALDDYIRGLEDGGVPPEMDADQQAKVDAAIGEYEEKYGIKIDRNDPEQVKAVMKYIEFQKQYADQRRTDVGKRLDDRKDLYKRAKGNLHKPEIMQELEAELETREGTKSVAKIFGGDGLGGRSALLTASGFEGGEVQVDEIDAKVVQSEASLDTGYGDLFGGDPVVGVPKGMGL